MCIRDRGTYSCVRAHLWVPCSQRKSQVPKIPSRLVRDDGNSSRCDQPITRQVVAMHRGTPVSYTHLDVYKRQQLTSISTNKNNKPGSNDIMRIL